jgi:hypothetical protein
VHVFIRGGLKLQSCFLKYPRDDVTCQWDACIPLANRHRHPYSKHDYSYLYATLLGKVFNHSDCLRSAKADFPLSKVETAFWCSFSRVPNWRLDWPKYSFSQSPHGIEYTARVILVPTNRWSQAIIQNVLENVLKNNKTIDIVFLKNESRTMIIFVSDLFLKVNHKTWSFLVGLSP